MEFKEFGIKEYILILNKYKVLIVLGVLLITSLTFIYNFRLPKIYRAGAEIFFLSSEKSTASVLPSFIAQMSGDSNSLSKIFATLLLSEQVLYELAEEFELSSKIMNLSSKDLKNNKEKEMFFLKSSLRFKESDIGKMRIIMESPHKEFNVEFVNFVLTKLPYYNQKFSLTSNKKFFFQLTSPKISNKPIRPKIRLNVLAACFAGVCLTTSLAIFYELFKWFKKQYF